MSTSSPATLEQAIQDSGEGWILSSFSAPDLAIQHIRQTLIAVQREARARFGNEEHPISEAVLLEAFGQNPQIVRAFFQALGGSRTPAMLLMVWRIIQGMEVKAIELGYERQQTFELRVVLESPYGEKDAPYTSTNIHDFSLLRHIGILEIGGSPVFDGFYPLKIRGV